MANQKKPIDIIETTTVPMPDGYEECGFCGQDRHRKQLTEQCAKTGLWVCSVCLYDKHKRAGAVFMGGSKGDTNESEVLDHQFGHEGNAPDLGWAAHDHEKDQPDRVVMDGEARVKGFDRREIDKIRRQTLFALFDFVLSDWGRQPCAADVGKKVLALAKFSGHRAVDSLSLGKIAAGSGETKAAMSARIRRMCNKPIERAGGIAKARFQQSPDQRAVSAKAQKGNSNRAGK